MAEGEPTYQRLMNVEARQGALQKQIDETARELILQGVHGAELLRRVKALAELLVGVQQQQQVGIHLLGELQRRMDAQERQAAFLEREIRRLERQALAELGKRLLDTEASG